MTEKMIETLVTNAPLVVPLMVMYWWATPRLVKSTLMNGGGEVVKRIVREANAEQSIAHAKDLARVGERLAILETRMKDHMEKKA